MKALTTLAFMALGLFLRGLAVSKLWLWFAVPAGARPVGYAVAYGLCCLGVLVSGTVGVKRHVADDPVTEAGANALVPLVFLGVGWVAHWLAS